MHKAVKRALTVEEIQTYRRDGVVLVRELVDPNWVGELQELVDQNIVQPSTMVRDINESGSTGNFFGDTFVCHHITGFRSFIFDSPAADVVSACMGSSRVNLIFEDQHPHDLAPRRPVLASCRRYDRHSVGSAGSCNL